MKKTKIVGALALMVMGISPAFAAENKVADFQASAEIENVCLIEADDVNFGQVYAPLTQQGSKSEMRVLCSKGTSYTVDLNYGGNFVDTNNSSSSGVYEAKVSHRTTDLAYTDFGSVGTSYRIFKNGEPIGAGRESPNSNGAYIEYNILGDSNYGDIYCSNEHPGKISYHSIEAAQLIGNNSLTTIRTMVADTHGLCDSGKINLSSFNSFFGVSANDKGAMIGAMKGNALAYQITIPGDITKPWIANVNSYQATASGEFDKIEVNARIMPDSSSSLYPAQDSYFDTVTAVISY